MYDVTFIQQELRKIRAVLARNAGIARFCKSLSKYDPRHLQGKRRRPLQLSISLP
jgi:hypothetical protein